MLQFAERIPPLLPSQIDRRPRFDGLPPFSKKAVARYQDNEQQSDLRAAIAEAAAILNKHAAAFQEAFPPVPDNQAQKNQYFTQLANQQMGLALVYNDLDSKFEELKLLADDVEKEVPQWQASYLYVQAMLYYRMAYFYSYNAMLGKIRKEELPRFNPQLHKGYRLIPKIKLDDRDAEKLAAEGRKLLLKLAQDHKDTPWEFIAKREMITNLGLEWVTYPLDQPDAKTSPASP
jgi:hypothetical protein